ncbi:hypothetical protein A5645_13515 [Mycobacterium asiaticum]|nr:hypothetical protein A5645_13515 [Mycobacterium asiaticum]
MLWFWNVKIQRVPPISIASDLTHYDLGKAGRTKSAAVGDNPAAKQYSTCEFRDDQVEMHLC